MNNEFKQIIDQFPSLMKQLVNSPLRSCSDPGSPPRKGIYVFYENGTPIYVGRTDRMRARIKEHGRPSSTNNHAPFAFNLAKKNAVEKGIDVNMQRGVLEKDSIFAELFSEAKKRVSQMSVKVIEINDPIIQTIFEVYASIDLKTEFNDFNTH
ncbi:MAG: GIY-YIG nuclease family protein [Candidatus Methanoperedens sp.]